MYHQVKPYKQSKMTHTKILDAKCNKADKPSIVSVYSHIPTTGQHDLLNLPTKYEELFDYMMALWDTMQVHFELGRLLTMTNIIHYLNYIWTC